MLVREALATQLLQRPNGFQETAQGEVSPFGHRRQEEGKGSHRKVQPARLSLLSWLIPIASLQRRTLSRMTSAVAFQTNALTRREVQGTPGVNRPR
jgi:hypothetical protein